MPTLLVVMNRQYLQLCSAGILFCTLSTNKNMLMTVSITDPAFTFSCKWGQTEAYPSTPPVWCVAQWEGPLDHKHETLAGIVWPRIPHIDNDRDSGKCYEGCIYLVFLWIFSIMCMDISPFSDIKLPQGPVSSVLMDRTIQAASHEHESD